jgi:hypothetical protein
MVVEWLRLNRAARLRRRLPMILVGMIVIGFGAALLIATGR